MSRFHTYRRADRTYLYSNAQLASAFAITGKLFAALCLCLGIATALLVSAPPEQRIFNAFFFGVIPALAFWLGGYFLSRWLVFSFEVCETLAKSCFHCLTRLTTQFVKCVAPPILDAAAGLVLRARRLLPELYDRSDKTYATADRLYWRVYTNLYELVCLLIRSTARIIIRIQELNSEVILVRDRQDAWRIFNPLSTSGRFRLLIIIGAFAAGIGIGWSGVFVSHRLLTVRQYDVQNELDALVERIIVLDPNGDQTAK
jgi:Zn-dependent protease with chaperone function